MKGSSRWPFRSSLTWRFPSHVGSIRLSLDPKSRLKATSRTGRDRGELLTGGVNASTFGTGQFVFQTFHVTWKGRVRERNRSIASTMLRYRWWRISMRNNRPDAINRRDRSYYRSPRCVLEEKSLQRTRSLVIGRRTIVTFDHCGKKRLIDLNEEE